MSTRPLIRIDGDEDLQRALRGLSDALEADVSAASEEIARRGARLLQRAARTPAERRVAGTVAIDRGRSPGIRAGGSDDVGRMFFGTEFGGGSRPRTRQFRPWSGTRGYWFYPTLRRSGRELADVWIEAIDSATAEHWRNR